MVSTLFAEGLLRVVIATPDLAWSTTERQFSAGLVIIKGTERYNAAKQRFEAYHQSAVLQMIGRAARRPAEGQAKDQAKVTVVVMCQDILKEFWVSALFCPMPLESGLRPLLPPGAEARHASSGSSGGGGGTRPPDCQTQLPSSTSFCGS